MLVQMIIWAILLSALPPNGQAQNVVTSFDLTGGSGAFVVRSSSTRKNTYVATRRKSNARRTSKQRRTTRRSVVRQSKSVARRSRSRRNIKQITPQQLQEIKIETKTREEASIILAGAGEYFVERGEVQKAAEYLEQAVELDPANTDAKLALSEAYTSLGDAVLEDSELTPAKVQKARGYYEFALKYDEKNASAYAGLGQVFDELGDEPQAKSNYEKALAIDPNFKQVYAPLGIIYYNEAKYDKSEEFIEKALSEDADNPETQYFIGLLKYQANENEKALAALQKSIRLDGENAEAFYYLGAVYDRLEKPLDAIKAFETAVRLEPNYVSAWFDLGNAYYNQNRFEDAIKAYDKAIQLNSNQTDELRALYTESFESRGDAYGKQAEKVETLGEAKEKIDKATGDYNIVSFQKKEDVEFLSKYGLALSRQASIYQSLKLQTSSWDRSIEFLEKAVRLSPDAINYTNLGFVNYRIGHLLTETGLPANKTKARPYLENAKIQLQKAVDMNPEFDEAPLINLGATYIDLGEYEKGIETLEKAARKKDLNMINFLLGIAYARSQKLKEASRYLTSAVERDAGNFMFLNALADVAILQKDKKAVRRVIEKLRRLGTVTALRKAESLEKLIN